MPSAPSVFEGTVMKRRSYQLMTLTGLVILIAGCGNNEEPPAPAHFDPTQITLREHGHLKELLDDQLVFVDDSGTEWIAPQGTLTDGASVPRLALPITDGRWAEEFLKAAVVHDAYCQVENETRTPEQYRTRPWREVHRMFHEACLAGGTTPLLAKIMFAAVWLGGPRWDDPSSNLEQVSSEALTRGFVGSRKWIEQNDPTVEQIITDMSRREPLLLELHELEAGILTALQSDNLTIAGALLREQEELLEREMQTSPDDLMLMTYEGYRHKNEAMLSRRTGNESRAIEELEHSEQVFSAVIGHEPDDPGALNGLGSVFILRGDLDRAEESIREALRIAPNYEAARSDLQLIERLREPPQPE